jgi:hypothetical protein
VCAPAHGAEKFYQLTCFAAPPTPETGGTLVRQNLMSLAVVQDRVRASLSPRVPTTFSNLKPEFALGGADILPSAPVADGNETPKTVSAVASECSCVSNQSLLGVHPGPSHMVRSTRGAI